jgi:cyanate permease
MPEILTASGMSAAEAGYWASVPTLVGVAASLTIPRFATQRRRMAILALLFVAAGAAAVTLLTVTGPILTAGLILQGLARATMMTVTLLVLVDIPEIGPKRAGAAGGMFFSAAEIGGVSGPLAMGLLYDSTGHFSAGLMVMTAITVGLLLLVAPLRQQLKNAPHPEH